MPSISSFDRIDLNSPEREGTASYESVGFIWAPFSLQTYVAAFYFLLIKPLYAGFCFFFAVFSFTFALIGTLFACVGIPLFVLFGFLWRGLAYFELIQTRVFLLGQVNPPAILLDETGFIETLKGLFRSPFTWYSLVYHIFLGLPLAIIWWTLSFIFLGLPAAALASCFFIFFCEKCEIETNVDQLDWIFSEPTGLAVLIPAAIILLFPGANGILWIRSVQRYCAINFLQQEDSYHRLSQSEYP